MSNTGIIYGVNGPVIYLKGDSGFKISEMVYVGPEHLVGEIIGLKKGMTTVQVFEETTGLKPGDTVTGTGDAISVLLGPGIIHNIFDGIQLPLEEIAKASGKYISRGVSVDSLDTEKKWNTHIIVKEGDVVGPGSIIAETQETDSILHKSMVPHSVRRRNHQRFGTCTEMADPYPETNPQTFPRKRPACHRPAYLGHSFPYRKGRYSRCSGRFRYR